MPEQPLQPTFQRSSRHRRAWTPAEDAAVLQMWPHHSREHIAHQLGRTPAAVGYRLEILGLSSYRNVCATCSTPYEGNRRGRPSRYCSIQCKRTGESRRRRLGEREFTCAHCQATFTSTIARKYCTTACNNKAWHARQEQLRRQVPTWDLTLEQNMNQVRTWLREGVGVREVSRRTGVDLWTLTSIKRGDAEERVEAS